MTARHGEGAHHKAKRLLSKNFGEKKLRNYTKVQKSEEMLSALTDGYEAIA